MLTSYEIMSIHIYDLNKIAIMAAYGGHLLIVNQMINFGADNYIQIVTVAASNGHAFIVNETDRLSVFSINDYTWLAYKVAVGGHISIVNQMLKNGVYEYTLIACGAAEGGWLFIVNHINNIYAFFVKDYNLIIEVAITYGHLPITKRMIELGANDYNKSAVIALEEGYLSIAYQMTTYIIEEYCVLIAAKEGCLFVVKQIIVELGINNYTNIIIAAEDCIPILNMFTDFGIISHYNIQDNDCEFSNLKICYKSI